MQAARKHGVDSKGAEVRAAAARREPSRLNLALPAETRDRLDRLQHEAGAVTLTETITNSLRLYEWLIEQRKRGREILVRETGKDPVAVEFVF